MNAGIFEDGKEATELQLKIVPTNALLTFVHVRAPHSSWLKFWLSQWINLSKSQPELATRVFICIDQLRREEFWVEEARKSFMNWEVKITSPYRLSAHGLWRR